MDRNNIFHVQKFSRLLLTIGSISVCDVAQATVGVATVADIDYKAVEAKQRS